MAPSKSRDNDTCKWKEGGVEIKRGGEGLFILFYDFRNVLYELNTNLTKVNEFSWGATPAEVENCELISVDDVSTCTNIFNYIQHTCTYMYVHVCTCMHGHVTVQYIDFSK